MNRRTFLTAAAAAVPTAEVQARAAKDGAAGPTSRHAPPSHTETFLLDELSIAELSARFQRGALNSEQAVKLYLRRIEQIDRSGPALRSILEPNPDALSIARSLDAERKTKGPRGPLHGVPIVLKDNIDTADRMQTTAGSLALLDRPSSKDAFVVTRLRAAGAVILGKTNLSEWANFRSTHSTSGWSARGGQTKNPYVLDRNPCGSSSGSAVAVSANLSMAAIGTETDGSVVCPSSVCGIVGIKPTLGLISRSGIIPIAQSQDTAGPMARSVRDAAILLSAMRGEDEQDPATQSDHARTAVDFARFLDPHALRGARIGIVRQYFRIGPAVDALMNNCIQLMRSAGAEIIDPADLPSYESWRETEQEVLLYEFKSGLNAYLANRKARITSLADCIAFNRENRSREMPFFEQELMEQAQAKGALTEKAYREALSTNQRLTQKEGIDAVLSEHRLDALVSPTSGPAWPTDWVNGDRADSGCASPPAVAGYPHITVPAGFVFGLPVGISFFGSAWSESKLIALAYAFEQASKVRQKPQFRPTVSFLG